MYFTTTEKDSFVALWWRFMIWWVKLIIKPKCIGRAFLCKTFHGNISKLTVFFYLFVYLDGSGVSETKSFVFTLILHFTIYYCLNTMLVWETEKKWRLKRLKSYDQKSIRAKIRIECFFWNAIFNKFVQSFRDYYIVSLTILLNCPRFFMRFPQIISFEEHLNCISRGFYQRIRSKIP